MGRKAKISRIELGPTAWLLASRQHHAILRTLHKCKRACTGRELSRLTGIHLPTVQKVLKELGGLGVLDVKKYGSSFAISLIGDNALIRDVLEPMLEAENRIIEEQRKAAELWGCKKCVAVVLIPGFTTDQMWAGEPAGLARIYFLPDTPKGQVMAEKMRATTPEVFRSALKKAEPWAKKIEECGISIYGKSVHELISG